MNRQQSSGGELTRERGRGGGGEHGLRKTTKDQAGNNHWPLSYTPAF